MAITSPLVSAFNNIVSLNKSKSSMKSTQDSYNKFLRFMNVEIRNIDSIKLPKKKDIQKLSTLNVASTFGSAGSLLSSLANGTLDAAGFVGDFFGGRKKGGAKPNPRAGAPNLKGTKLGIGGFRALGIANAIFAGLDFATGLAEGESVGKAAAGAGGALAGSLIGGAIGQALIPVPGLGFVVGSMAGNFLGGYLGDRAHESMTGEKSLEQKTKEKLKAQEIKQREAAKVSSLTIGEVMDKFDMVVSKFQEVVYMGTLGRINESSQDAEVSQEEILENDQYGYRDTSGSQLGGTLEELESSGGVLPSSKLGSKYGVRDHPIRGGRRMHYGNDYPMPTGTPISVIQPGVVANAGYVANGYGVQVKVDHPGGVSSFYAHLNSTNVKAGQQITPGTVIGSVGSTGQSTGPHLHFEVDVAGKRGVDPTPYQDKLFRFGGNVRVKPKKQENTEISKDINADSQVTQQLQSTQIPKQPVVVPFQNIKKSEVIPTTQSDPVDNNVTSTQTYDNLNYSLSNLPQVDISQIQPQGITMIVVPQQLEQYPDYNQPQSSLTIMPIIPQAGGQSRPVVISGGGGGGGSQTIIMPPPPTGQVLNSLFKTMLLTNLSAT